MSFNLKQTEKNYLILVQETVSVLYYQYQSWYLGIVANI